jgi:hypothetical protein
MALTFNVLLSLISFLEKLFSFRSHQTKLTSHFRVRSSRLDNLLQVFQLILVPNVQVQCRLVQRTLPKLMITIKLT